MKGVKAAATAATLLAVGGVAAKAVASAAGVTASAATHAAFGLGGTQHGAGGRSARQAAA